MTTDIYSTDYYELYYNRGKNRVHFKIKKFWPSINSVPEYLNHWTTILKDVVKGFTVFSDFRNAREQQTTKIQNLHSVASKMQEQKGVRKIAKIISSDVSSTVLNNTTDGLNSKISRVKRTFNSPIEAIQWLDE